MPYAVCCAILGVSISWLYKWLDRPATARQRRRAELDAEVLKMFKASKLMYGSPRILADLVGAGQRTFYRMPYAGVLRETPH